MKPFLSRSYLLHTTLLPIFFVLHTWNNFHYLVKFKDIFVILLGILIFSFTLLSITILFLRNRKKASVLNFFLIAYMLFYGYIYDQLQHYIKFLSRHSILLTAFLLLFIAGVFFLKRRKDNRLEKSTMYLNSLLLIFCIYEITNTLLILNTNNKKENSTTITSTQSQTVYPNIYLLVFDEYASSKSLKRDYGYDNSSIDSFLINSGFFLMKDSKSNYLRTNLSIASLLNFDYTSGFSPREGMTADDLLKSHRLIKYNALFDLAKNNGYEIYNYTIFDTEKSPSKVKNDYLFNNERIIISNTMISRLINDLGPSLPFPFLKKILGTDITAETYRKYNERAVRLYLTELKTKKNSTPKLTYAHFLMPHPPFIYDSLLNPIYFDNQKMENYYEKKFIPKYLSYLSYTNKHLKKILETTLKENNNNCIIFILGDHGYKIMDDSSLTNDHFFNNLQALYLPSKYYDPLKSSSTPVNVMRHIVNIAFQKRLPFLKDSSVLIGNKW